MDSVYRGAALGGQEVLEYLSGGIEQLVGLYGGVLMRPLQGRSCTLRPAMGHL